MGIIEDIQTNGYAIVPEILTQEECTHVKDGIDRWLTDYCGVDLDSIVPGVKPGGFPYTKHGVILENGVGHLQELWDLRCNEEIRYAFSEVYDAFGIPDADDLIVSFDGICVMYPYSDASLRSMKCNLHLDQSKGNCLPGYNVNDFQCVQGFVTLLDMDQNHGTFRVMKGSNRFFDQITPKMPDSKSGKWYQIDDDDYQFLLDSGCEDVRIDAPAGSLVIWDSRTVHTAAIHKKEIPIPDRKWRYIAYLSYSPRSMCTGANLRKRIKAFEEMRMIGYFSSYPLLHPKFPDSRYCKDYHVPYLHEKPVLDDVGKRLVGYDV